MPRLLPQHAQSVVRRHTLNYLRWIGRILVQVAHHDQGGEASFAAQGFGKVKSWPANAGRAVDNAQGKSKHVLAEVHGEVSPHDQEVVGVFVGGIEAVGHRHLAEQGPGRKHFGDWQLNRLGAVGGGKVHDLGGAREGSR